MFDTYQGNSDNGGCSECWDTENIVFDDEPEWMEITGEQIDEMGEHYESN